MNVREYGNDGQRMAAGDSGRRMLDTNKGITNVGSYDQFRKDLSATLNHVVALLEPHCGPKSKYAMVVTGLGNGTFEPNIFTKDGIKTLSFVEYASPIQAYVKELVTYIGKRVDNIAKDGTTTSMLCAAKFVLNCMDTFDAFPATLTTVQKEKIFKELVTELRTAIDASAWTMATMREAFPDVTDSELGGLVAFMQTMSSSGGNYELASVMRDVFRSSPPETWEHLQMSQSTLEKEKTFEVRYQESDYRILSMATSMRLFNTDLNTRYVCDDVKVFVYPDQIDYGMVILDRVTDLIRSFPDTQSLAIVAKQLNPLVIKMADQANMSRKHPISLHIVQDDNKFSRSDWELMAILAMAGVPTMVGLEDVPDITPEYLITAKRVEVNGSYLDLFGICPEGKEGDRLHPFYLDKTKYQPYTDLCKALMSIIYRAKNGHDRNEYLENKASAILLQMTALHAPTILIGGNTHENLSNLAVVQDCLGATRESINSGFLVGGMLTMLLKLNEMIQELSTVQRTDAVRFKQYILSNLHVTLLDISELVYDRCIDLKSSEWNKSSYINALRSMLVESVPLNNEMACSMNVYAYRCLATDHDLEELSCNYPILQPVEIYKELFARIGELMIRLLSTDKIVVPHGAFVESMLDTTKE